MPRITKMEQAIRDTGAIQYGEFTAHNGQQGNCKVVLDELLNGDQHLPLLNKVVESLARKLNPFGPEILIPMPEGANSLGGRLARRLGARAILLEWQDKESGRLRFKDQGERIVVCRAERVVLVDDVLRTGSSFVQAIESAELEDKELIAGVVWDRSNPQDPSSLDFRVESLVKKFVPLQLEPDVVSK